MRVEGRRFGADDVTDELDRRSSRSPDHKAENHALRSLAEVMSTEPGAALQRLAEAAMELTGSASAGVSLLELRGGTDVFRCVATAGVYGPNVDAIMPREASLRDAVLLMNEPERVIPGLAQVRANIREKLLAPFHVDGALVGTIWAVKHGRENPFDREDARLLENLAHLAAAAHRLVAALTALQAARRESEAERLHEEVGAGESWPAYRKLAEMIDGGFCTLEVLFTPEGRPCDYRYIEVNPAFARRTGLTDVAGRTARELMPDHPQHWFDTFARILRNGRPERFNEEQEALGLWHEVYAVPIGEPGQNRLAVLFRDGLPGLRAAEALRESEERFRAFVMASSDVVYSMSPDWSHMRRLTGQGFRPDLVEPSGTWMDSYIQPDDRPGVRVTVDQAIAGRSMFELEHRVRRADGTLGWTLSRAVPILDEGGEIREWLGASSDVTDRKRAEEALRVSEELFRSFTENSADTLWILDVGTRQLEYLSPAFESMWGESRERTMADLDRWGEMLHPGDRERASRGMRRLLAGETYQQEYRIVRPSDGAVRWIHDTGFPIRDEAGLVSRVAGIAQDVTERRVSEDRVKASRRRLRTLIKGIPQLVWCAGGGGEWTWASPQWTTFTGLSETESRGLGWLSAVHEDDRQRALDAWERAGSEGGFEVEYRIRQAADGRSRWFQTRAVAVRDEDGTIVEWLGTSTDIDEMRGLHEHRKLLLGELQHRVRHMLAVVRSIARRTAYTSETVEDYAAHLDGRLSAFALAQAAMTRDPTSGISLRSLVAEELAAYGARETEPRTRGQVTIGGPEIRLTPKAAETLGLAMHELATNAVKYGALAPGLASGRVSVDWRLDGSPEAPTLVLEWSETLPRGPAPPDPVRRGFGTQILENSLKYELKARTELEFTQTGLYSRIEVPLSDQLVWNALPVQA